jgi:hypothetical protein
MPRLIRKTAILAKVETTYGVDSTPTGAANAILISNASFNIDYSNVSRDLIRPFLGGSEELSGTRFARAQFEVEWANSGTAGTAPAWGPLLRACGFAEASLTAPVRVEYTPISATFTSLTIYYHLDGALRKITGAIGNVEFRMGEGERPIMAFDFTGLDGGTTVTADPTVTLTAFKTPAVVNDVNSGDIKLGGTYSAGTITGGTPYPSRGLNINIGNTVSPIALLGGQRASLTQREVTGSMQLDLSAADEVTFRTAVNTNALTSLSFEHQTGAGVGMLFHAPTVQRINPQDQDFNGEAQMSMDLRFTPSTGNDELRLVLL